MDCLPTTGSGPLGLRGSAPADPSWPMMSSSKTRSTASRRTLRPTSISTGCLAYRGNRQRQECNKPDQHRVGALVKREGGTNVRGGSIAATISHHGVLALAPAIAARARERETERAGHRRLGIAGVRRTVTWCVTD